MAATVNLIARQAKVYIINTLSYQQGIIFDDNIMHPCYHPKNVHSILSHLCSFPLRVYYVNIYNHLPLMLTISLIFDYVQMHLSEVGFKQIYSVVRHNQINAILYAALIFICELNRNIWSVKSPVIPSIFRLWMILISSLLASTGAERGVSLKPLVRTVYIKHFEHTLLVKLLKIIRCITW